jgi:uncharacterized protein YgiM (DUF1202 family)
MLNSFANKFAAKRVARISVVVLVAMIAVACTQQSSGPQTASGVDAAAASSANSYVITQDTLLYKNGPAQPMPPDGTLHAGTTVTRLKRLGNFTLVQTSDGIKGYVATSDISAGH